MRSIGAGGAGHGTWSTPAAVQLPAAAAPPISARGAGAADERQLVPAGGRGRKKAAGGDGEGGGASEARARRRPAKGVSCHQGVVQDAWRFQAACPSVSRASGKQRLWSLLISVFAMRTCGHLLSQLSAGNVGTCG